MKTQFIDISDYVNEITVMIEEGRKRSEELMNKNPEVTKLAREILGWPGAMLSGSKSGYRDSYPKNVAVFNANIVTPNGKVWYGDFDLTKSEGKLIELAEKSGETVFLLYEMDARFENEEKPRLDKAIYAVTPKGKTIFFSYAERASAGKLKGKVVNKNRE